LRGVTLAIVLLLLWNPNLPGGAGLPGANVPWILIDASVSMTSASNSGAPTTEAGGSSVWAEALERSRQLSGGDTHVATFGGPLIGPEPGDLEGPDRRQSLLGPTLDRAIESGASEVTVISDMRIADVAVVLRRLAASAIPVRFEAVGPSAGLNAGIGRFEAPRSVLRSDSIPLVFSVISEGVVDSLDVRVLEEGQVVSVLRAAPATPGRESVIRVSVATPDEPGPVRYSAEVMAIGDQFSRDDRRDVLVEVDPEAGGLVLVSFDPDWEPRFLLPVLERVTGLTPHGFIQLTAGRFLSLESGPGGGAIREVDEVRSRVEGAELLVVHGASADLPQWVSDAAISASRSVVFALDAEGAATFGHLVGTTRDGEWYASSDPTPSALAGTLVNTQWSSLPPLSRLLPGDGALTGDVPLMIQLQGSGQAEPAMVMTSEGSRRRVTVLSTGYWRWAFRAGAAREAYRRLWSAVAGWLLANEPLSGGPGVRPVEAVFPVGVAQDWRARELAGGELRVVVGVRGSAEGAVLDTTITVPQPGVFKMPGLPEGDYTYQAFYQASDQAFSVDEPVGGGRFLVDGHSPDMSLPVVPPPEATGSEAGGTDASGPLGSPLRSLPLPYLIVLVLLSAEWVLRRRRGLR